MPEESISCPKCYSTDLTTSTKGVSVTKGLIFLLWGLKGRKDIIVTCLKCGHKFPPGKAHSGPAPGAIDIDAVNRRLEERKRRAEADAVKTTQAAHSGSIAAQLQERADMKAKGLLRDDEFTAAKKKLLA